MPPEETKIQNEQKDIPVEVGNVDLVDEKPKVEQAQTELTAVAQSVQSTPPQPQIKVVEKIIYKTPSNFVQNLLVRARAKIQERKRKKLDKIMLLFDASPQITSGDVQKLLFAKKRTVTNYLDQLEREQKIIQVGIKGKGVFYTKKQ